MSVYSMTGYASAQADIRSAPLVTGSKPDNIQVTQATPATPSNCVQLSVEIRSVNSRFLDISFRLPDELRQTEPALRALLTAQIKRGKVELRVALENTNSNIPSFPSAEMLQYLQTVQHSIQTALPEARTLSVADVLRLSNGQNSGQSSGQSSASAQAADTTQALMQLSQAVIADLLSSREREGARLALMLQDRIAQLRDLAALAGPMIPLLVAQQRLKFMERWNEALALGTADTPSKAFSAMTEQAAMDRALSESTAFAIRIDVAEELTRLASHLDEIERLLNKGGENGKRLDFLIQELHREANTLGSKSSVLELSRISVEMKVLIEQMREQVQNIE